MQRKHYNIISVLKHFKMVNYKITKVLHAKLNFYKYIKVYTSILHKRVNSLLFKLNIYISLTK